MSSRTEVGSHPCGAPLTRIRARADGTCSTRVSDTRGVDARCLKHTPTRDWQPDPEIARVVNELTAPMFTYRMSRAQVSRQDAQGERMRKATRTAEAKIRGVIKSFSETPGVVYVPAAKMPREIRKHPNGNVMQDDKGELWVRMSAADALLQRTKRDVAAAALESAAKAASSLGVVSHNWLRLRALEVRKGA